MTETPSPGVPAPDTRPPEERPPDADNPDQADAPDPAFEETEDETGETPVTGEEDEQVDDLPTAS